MSRQRVPFDPMDDGSYRAAVRRANGRGIQLTPVSADGQWTVTACTREIGNGTQPRSAEGRGSTAAFAAWQALSALQEQTDR